MLRIIAGVFSGIAAYCIYDTVRREDVTYIQPCADDSCNDTIGIGTAPVASRVYLDSDGDGQWFVNPPEYSASPEYYLP